MKEATRKNFWVCNFKISRGCIRFCRNNYTGAIDDLNYILEIGGLIYFEHTLYKILGVCYAYNEDYQEGTMN